ncbi:Helix-turn-helix domain-containing protein [Nonomuraea maritima]|uniref:Helix-turn-helix domain-containing protein n=1 Tax=Nonomuraea maritima TaxID=683260 RepID=A0A1G9A1H2_9ACTN|nr:helix-turn-helix transcriptional regulator [Nonomuraea maritima]SDK21183.1 Helix-turn-helix domain-containing protein [Nonomuraea maritima]
MAKQDLARFLRDRRESLRPEDLGLPPGRRRRTPGLRREEVAELAGMSADYYTRLEQARGPRPSAAVLDALTGALRLDLVERTHLFQLAGTPHTPPPGPVRRVRPYVAGLLERLPDTAAFVTDARYDVIAWNPLADALLGDHLRAEPNLARRRFLGEQPFYAEGASWEEFGGVVVSRLRRAAERHPGDRALGGLLAELRAGSEEFVALWAANPVHAPGHRTKTLRHRELGPLKVNCDVLVVPDDDHQVVFMTADAGSPAARALRHLRPVDGP